MDRMMLIAGIDIGHQSVKVVILEGNKIIIHGTMVIAGPVEAAAKKAYERILKKAGLTTRAAHRLFATGSGRENVLFAHGHPTEMLSHAKGAHWLFETARTVIDIGAEGTRIMKCDKKGNLTDFQINDKCAAGTGVFLETVAEMMQMPIAQVGHLSLQSSRKIDLTSTCAVFAESEIVAEIHRGTTKEDILMGAHDAIVAKIKSSTRRINIEPELVLTGGVARNVGVIEALRRQLNVDIKVPEAPEIVGALGAAILARDRGQ
jgi:predicted CoA-substrate-specific enzyme activase